MKYNYTPFPEKALQDITAADLRKLKEVTEGWYIEYKENTISIKKIAKQLSAFANQYGGFLFIGIKESEDGTRKADKFIGINNMDVGDEIIKISIASTQHISPPVRYEVYVISGPCKEIGLEEGKSIIIIGIPQGDDPPYIHSSGRIYRRQADQSNPKEETDRNVLDRLWERGQTNKEFIDSVFSEVPTLQESIINTPWVYINFIPDPYSNYPNRKLTFEEFSKYTKFSHINLKGLSTPMQSVFPSDYGFTARQTQNNNPNVSTPTLRWWNDSSARFEIPVPNYTHKMLHTVNSLKYNKQFHQILLQQLLGELLILDFTYIIQNIVGMSNTYINLLRYINDSRKIYSHFTIRNTFFTIPYFDNKKYIDRCKSYGTPVIQEKSITSATTKYFDNAIISSNPLFEDSNNNDQIVSPFIFSTHIAAMILLSLGVFVDPDDLSIEMLLHGTE